MLNSDVSPATLAAAKAAIRTALQYRGCLADSIAWAEVWEELKALQADARACGLPISPADWVYIAELVDAACDDDGLPRLFDGGKT